MNGPWSAICRRRAKRTARKRFWMWPPAGWTNCRDWKSGCTSWRRRGMCPRPEYLEAHAKHDKLNDPQVETKAKKMLRGLGYRDADFDRKAREMSGGWIMRARLARLLVMEPDLLLLDEPTNHLDLLSLLWLQNYLKNYSGALLLISHDRQFMDEVVDQVHEISEKKLIAYTGNYSDYLAAARGTLRAATGRLQQPAEGDCGAPAIRGSVPLGDLQGLAGHEQAQADRAHGADRETAGSAQAVPISNSAAAARRSAGRHAGGDPHGLRREPGLRGAGPHHRTRRADRAGRAERRGQIHAAEDSGGRGGVSGGRARSRVTTRRSVTSASIARTRSIPERTVLEEVLASAPLMREDEARGGARFLHVPQGRHLTNRPGCSAAAKRAGST